MKKVNKEVASTEVLNPQVKTVETPTVEIPAKPKKKRYHKKPKQVVIDTPVVDVIVEKVELTPIKPHLNWLQKQWNKIVLWYNS
jgi:hypothetical protein